MHCSYCTTAVADEDDYLECEQCASVVHAKCLRTCRPGDLLGDIFFDFICADCMDLQFNEPSTSKSAKLAAPRENFVRQRLSWFMIVVLTLYNLSIKSKGLSHHGFFHWRSHIVSFINKNWDYLMEAGTRRRKNWFGSISGNLSHYSPDFFLSGQETMQKSGWWRLVQTNATPKMIQKKFEEFGQKRAKMRNGKKSLEDSDNTNVQQQLESKRPRLQSDSDDDLPPLMDGCSRTIPYMGRTPKIAKQLNIVDEDFKHLQQQQPLNTVQSSLMDFLAENLNNCDLFGNLPNIATDTLVGGSGDGVYVDGDDKSDILPLLDTHKNDTLCLFGATEAKCSSNACNSNTTTEQTSDKLNCIEEEDSLQTPSEYSNEDDDDADDEAYQPRIIQVINFQEQLTQLPTSDQVSIVNTQVNNEIKGELKSDAEQSDIEGKSATKLNVKSEKLKSACEENEVEVGGSSTAKMGNICKPSLFTKVPRRNWPWLVEKSSEEAEQMDDDKQTKENNPFEQSDNLTMMSEYEEIELLQKLRKVFEVEEKNKLEIPAYVRRFYRKLCIRNWKREHGKPQFNLDEQITGKQTSHDADTQAQIIDRYQLITNTTSTKKYKTFYARIAGSFDYEMFESPYSHRILHPFIFRDEEIAPPWLKLMCELQFKVNKKYPTRSAIDFCYVRPNHIAAVNALLQTTFWPGIDMSECLSYPDYSVVALYKKLVVGCGFLVPDVGFNEAYISFMAVRPNWQRCGIGTFMLYHLIQTCMTKDITLHVSASNPAIVLYQKFGFKIEEIIHDFYEKYLPIDSKESRTAFFLRLLRS